MGRELGRKPVAKPRLHLKVYRGKDYHSTISAAENERELKAQFKEFCSAYFARERHRKSTRGEAS